MIEKDGDHQVEIAGKRGKNKPVNPAVDPPDGGWGWFVVFGVFISTALAQGAVATYPIFYLPLMQEFGIGLGEVTWLTGCYEFGRAFGYLFAPILVDKLGYRETGVLVSIASSIGICLAAFSPTPIMAYLLAGVIPGCSYGIVSTVHYVVIVKYFYKRQMLALGLSHTGAAFETLSLAPLLQYLIDLYGWRGAILLLGGLSFNYTVASMLYRPIRLKSDKSRDENNGNAIRDIIKTTNLCLSRKTFWLLVAITFAAFSRWRAYLTFLIPFAREDLHVDPMQSSSLLSIYSVLNMPSRFGAGALGDLERVNIVWVLLVSQLISAFIAASAWFAATYAGLIANTAVHSLMNGPIHVMYVPLLGEVVGENKIQWAIGLCGFLINVLGFGVLPLIGYLIDTFGDMRLSFLISAVLATVAAILHIPLLRNRPTRS